MATSIKGQYMLSIKKDTKPAFPLWGLLLALPGLAAAEDYYVKSKGYRTEPAPEPPAYVRNLSRTPFEQFRDVDWLDVGLDFRTRYEYRENDLRFWTDTTSGKAATRYRDRPDDLWLLRTRAYLGVKDILDPLRFAVEFQDSRSYNGLYEPSVNDVNEFELIQGYAELYFNHALGHNRPLSLRAGRMHFEQLDRRLIASNEFRNTTNNFEGFRLRFGKKQNDWDLDTFALQPVERLKYEFDRPEEKTWFYGAILSLRRWSEIITIQPYFMGRSVNGNPYAATEAVNDLNIYAPGLRVYGVIPNTAFDFDADINKQLGESGVTRTINGQKAQLMGEHDALAYSLELGYTFDHDWKPRLSGYYGFGTGDRNPNDSDNDRFDAFFGFNQPWSRNDYYSWDNLHAPKVRLEFTPHEEVRVDMGYGAFWLDSKTDGFRRAGLRDTSGNSGDFMGHEFDIRMRHKLNAYVDWSLSYARYTPGDFTTSFDTPVTGPFTSEPSNFFYFEVSMNAFGDGKL